MITETRAVMAYLSLVCTFGDTLTVIAPIRSLLSGYPPCIYLQAVCLTAVLHIVVKFENVEALPEHLG